MGEKKRRMAAAKAVASKGPVRFQKRQPDKVQPKVAFGAGARKRVERPHNIHIKPVA